MPKILDGIVAIQAAMRAAHDRKIIDTIYGRPDLLLELGRSLAVTKPNLSRAEPSTLFGIQHIPVSMFPVVTACSACNGTGEGGSEATYCPTCDGAGALRNEGMLRSEGEFMLIRSALPKKFAPHFPIDTPLPRRPATRSRTIPYPARG